MPSHMPELVDFLDKGAWTDVRNDKRLDMARGSWGFHQRGREASQLRYPRWSEGLGRQGDISTRAWKLATQETPFLCKLWPHSVLPVLSSAHRLFDRELVFRQ